MIIIIITIIIIIIIIIRVISKINYTNIIIIFTKMVIKEWSWTELNKIKLNWTELIRAELNWTELNRTELNWTENKLGRTGSNSPILFWYFILTFSCLNISTRNIKIQRKDYITCKYYSVMLVFLKYLRSILRNQYKYWSKDISIIKEFTQLIDIVA